MFLKTLSWFRRRCARRCAINPLPVRSNRHTAVAPPPERRRFNSIQKLRTWFLVSQIVSLSFIEPSGIGSGRNRASPLAPPAEENGQKMAAGNGVLPVSALKHLLPSSSRHRRVRPPPEENRHTEHCRATRTTATGTDAMRTHITSCLLLWTLTAAAVSRGDEITVKSATNGVDLSCSGGVLRSSRGDAVGHLTYRDDNSACENCIHLDVATIAGLVVGNVVATVVMGVAVYLIASQNRPIKSHKKSSDKQLLVLNEGGGANNEPYQALQPKRDTYDFLSGKR
ncbi:uncharacterized protein [Antennarius striatus]|uniref:uncharacterized protein isoform X1 n=1 Tax=Antennarius striatus TaxID=241820 RepID=UPI0035ADD424